MIPSATCFYLFLFVSGFGTRSSRYVSFFILGLGHGGRVTASGYDRGNHCGATLMHLVLEFFFLPTLHFVSLLGGFHFRLPRQIFFLTSPLRGLCCAGPAMYSTSFFMSKRWTQQRTAVIFYFQIKTMAMALTRCKEVKPVRYP